MPRVSIITAAYNHVRFIRESVESAQSQTYRDFEHIVIDDGSSDGTADVLKSFGDQITYIRQENRGAHAAINEGIRRSSGEYIALLDSDDVWLPNKLQLQMEAVETFPDAGLIYSLSYMIDANGKRMNNGQIWGKPPADPKRAFEELWKENCMLALTTVVKRTCMDEVGSFSEKFKAMSDWDLWIRIAAKWPVICVAEPLALYRVHGNNSWHSLVESGRVEKERLQLLVNSARVLCDHTLEGKPSREVIGAKFADLVLKSAYGDWYRYRYSKAISSLIFGLRLDSSLLKDGILALQKQRALVTGSHRFGLKLLFGERGIGTLRHFGFRF